MRKVILLLFLVFFTTGIWAQPIPVKSTHTVIIDTDCGIDDFRAISLLLSRPEILINAIFLSDGSLPPDEGIVKIRSLLHEFNCESIPVACGEILPGIDPPWRDFNRQVKWGGETSFQATGSTALECLAEELRNTDEKVTLVCLGPLTNIARLIKKDKDLLSNIERVTWYNGSVKPLSGFNYECDRKSVDFVFNSGVRIDLISNLDKEEMLFDSSMYAACQKSRTPLASTLYNVHRQPAVQEKLQENHFRLCDELAVLYITNPELFDINTLLDNVHVRYNQDYNAQGIKEAIYDMINGIYSPRQNIAFNRFPDQREMFNYDIRPIMDSAIALHGSDEWKAQVLTAEFHGHLGVFSIVGVKMGIKACELFGVGPDMLTVKTDAGFKPPYSCLNDGIQVSTGATLGMGTIELSDESIARPSAVFTYKNHSVRITLKKEYLEQIDADINEGIVKFGLLDDGYWKLIRRNALKYWLDWDRDIIFDIEKINP
jgi:pyrimidine-specific ribonucleoside hydrolase